MAIFTPSESPAVVVKETDLTSVVRNAQSTTGAVVGNFRWGPVLERVKIADEGQLVEVFGSPDDLNTTDFHSAAMFLKYSQDLFVVRNIDSDSTNAFSSGEGNAAPVVTNRENFDIQTAALDSDGHTFIAKWPGALGNSLTISVCPVSTGSTVFNGWTYRNSFDGAPATSPYATAKGATNDEVHVAIIDRLGQFSGTPGAVIETFPYLSLASDAKTSDGSTNYIVDVINNRSRYIWAAGFDAAYTTANAGLPAISGRNFVLASPAVKTVNLSGGLNSGLLDVGDILTAFDLFDDVDTVQVDFLVAPQGVSRVNTTSIVNGLVSIAQSIRKDCVVVTSPAKEDVVNNPSPAVATIATANTFTNSSYLIVDNNYLKIYDRYNDKYIFVPAAPSTAGIMAASDLNAAPWFSPAGSRRGQYLGITSLAYSPNKSQRDTLYRAGVNPIANIPGQGILLYGDKTKLSRPSAFDRINVRRLFLVIERAIADAAKAVIFEFNDEFTRAEFVNIVEPFLREIQGRRGITDFRVVCDETNNTPAVVDRNEFKADIFIKPARSINYVTLNFVAVRTGVQFEEVIGTV